MISQDMAPEYIKLSGNSFNLDPSLSGLGGWVQASPRISRAVLMLTAHYPGQQAPLCHAWAGRVWRGSVAAPGGGRWRRRDAQPQPSASTQPPPAPFRNLLIASRGADPARSFLPCKGRYVPATLYASGPRV